MGLSEYSTVISPFTETLVASSQHRQSHIAEHHEQSSTFSRKTRTMSTEAPIDALKLTTTESKSARKKRAKAAEASKETSEPSVSTPLESTEDPMAQEATTNGYESSYVKELQKYNHPMSYSRTVIDLHW